MRSLSSTCAEELWVEIDCGIFGHSPGGRDWLFIRCSRVSSAFLDSRETAAKKEYWHDESPSHDSFRT